MHIKCFEFYVLSAISLQCGTAPELSHIASVSQEELSIPGSISLYYTLVISRLGGEVVYEVTTQSFYQSLLM